MKKPISVHTLMQRINRQLKKEGQILRKVNPNHDVTIHDLGYYYIEDEKTVVAHHIELKDLALELKCLRPIEELIEE
jgi:hypothetical protein